MPLPVNSFTARPGNTEKETIISIFTSIKSIQDSFLVLCESETDKDHECTKGDGVRIWASRNPGMLNHVINSPSNNCTLSEFCLELCNNAFDDPQWCVIGHLYRIES